MISSENRAILRRWARGGLPWALLILAGWLVLTDMQGRELVPEGSGAPALQATRTDGSLLSLDEFEGQVLVLNFWATWCPPCRMEAPALSRTHAALTRSQEGMVLGASLDQATLSQIEEAAQEMGMNVPIVQPSPEMVAAYRVTQLPTTYVINGNGMIVETFVGAVDDDDLERAIAAARGP